MLFIAIIIHTPQVRIATIVGRHKFLTKCWNKLYLEDLRNSFLYNRLLPILIGCMDGQVVQGDSKRERRLWVRDAVFIPYVYFFDVKLHILDYLRDQLFDKRFIQLVIYKMKPYYRESLYGKDGASSMFRTVARVLSRSSKQVCLKKTFNCDRWWREPGETSAV